MNSKEMIMRMKWAVWIMLLALFVMPGVADDMGVQAHYNASPIAGEEAMETPGVGDTGVADPLILSLKDMNSIVIPSAIAGNAAGHICNA